MCRLLHFVTLGRVTDRMHQNAESMWKEYKNSQDCNKCRLLHFDLFLWVQLQMKMRQITIVYMGSISKIR